MSKRTCILIALAAFLAGYYFSAKVAASFVGNFLKPSV